MKLFPFAAMTAAIALGACAPAPAPAPIPQPLPVAANSGFEAREPDLCKARTYIASLGQPGTIIPTLGITKTYRVVEYRGIEPQEYDPNRIVFRLDASGNIYNIDCG